MIKMVCPECKTFLNKDCKKYFCSRCQRDYIVKNEIVCFNDTNHYYGELPQTEMQEFLKLAESHGWEKTVSTYLPSKNPGLIRTINDPERKSWTSLLSLKGSEIALDFGCGLGGVSVQLADLVSKVVALDGCYDRIRFLQIRRNQEKLQNIFLICNGNAHKLPFPDDFFDIIVLNMVFPYLASTLPEYNSSTAENLILREIIRTLKPRGKLYMSVRNKYYLHRLKRRIFQFRVPEVENFHYQGYRYYHRLMLASGLSNIKSFWLLPNYKYPKYIVPLNDKLVKINKQVDQIKEFSSLKKKIVKITNRIWGLKFLVESISFVAQKSV